jgi:hypothetical protein
VADQGGEAIRAHALMAEEVERRRQTARGLGLAGHVQTGYHGEW